MPYQLYVDPYPSGINYEQKFIQVNGSIVLAGSYPAGGEGLDWTNLKTGLPYNFPSNMVLSGVGNNASALITNISPSAGIVTVTAANRFTVGQQVQFVGLTTALGLLLNGLYFPVATANATTFTVLTPLTAASGADTGLAVYGNPVELAPIPGPIITAPVTSLAVASGVVTVTAANSFVAGASVSFRSLTTALGLLLNANGPFKITFANATTFKFATALTGGAGADTGTATASIPGLPTLVDFWSENSSGYSYGIARQNQLFHVQVGAASASLPNADLAAGAYPAGVLSDIIRFQANFAKD